MYNYRIITGIKKKVSDLKMAAVDIPSGINAGTGELMGIGISDET